MPTIYKPKKREQKSNNMYDDTRRKIYNSERWRKLRAWKMVNNPLCEVCWQKGLATPAEDVHHIVSFMTTNDPLPVSYTHLTLPTILRV